MYVWLGPGHCCWEFCRIFLQIFPFIFLCIGCTPLILAATAGHASTVEILLDNGADIEAQSDRTKDTALSLACSGGRQEVCDTCTCIWNCYKGFLLSNMYVQHFKTIFPAWSSKFYYAGDTSFFYFMIIYMNFGEVRKKIFFAGKISINTFQMDIK